MLWKELFTSRARGFARFVGFLVALVGGGTLLYYTIWFGALAFLEQWDLGGRGGMGNQPGGFLMFSTHRWQFRAYLQVVLPFVYIAGILSVAGAAAASITSEHEEDTWVSLTSTDLSGREILLAKLYGALWRPRMIVVAMLLMAFLGAISGSIHPLGLPALGLSLAVFGWFAAALGLWISLQLRSTWRAQFLTTSSLLLANLLGQAILSNVQRFAPLAWPGFTPMDICKTMLFSDLTPGLRDEFRRWKYAIPPVDYGEAWSLVFWVLSLTIYLAGAVALTWLALRKFDSVAGRARRAGTMSQASTEAPSSSPPEGAPLSRPLNNPANASA